MTDQGALKRYQDASARVGDRLRSAGVDDESIAANLPPTLDARLGRLLHAQPEHELTPGAYVERLVTPDRTTQGRRLSADLSGTLDAIENQFGIPGAICLAIWGVETNFGTAMGDWPVVGALTTLAAIDARRRAFWESERDAAVDLLCAGNLAGRVLNGSWAGAMGHVQFMPSTCRRYALDFDGDGFADIWNSPTDALASAANYLVEHGWQPGQIAVREVMTRADFDWLADLKASRTLRDWNAIGLHVAQADAEIVDADAETLLRLIAPEGAHGPLFLAGPNFDSLLAYNSSVPYALAVSLLGDRIAGQASRIAAWRPPDHGLSRAEKVQLQRRLSAMGWDTGGVDGILGVRSRDAVRELQKVLGLAVDGYADRELFNALDASGLSDTDA